MTTQQAVKPPYVMKFDAGTIKHLGLQMYSTLPPVIGELVANGWDANASRVEITIPVTPLDPNDSEIVIRDDGTGMSDQDVRSKYVITGRDRRESENTDESPPPLKRKVMGRKGIGKFSSFGIAKEIEIESVKGWRDESIRDELRPNDGAGRRTLNRVRGSAGNRHGLQRDEDHSPQIHQVQHKVNRNKLAPQTSR